MARCCPTVKSQRIRRLATVTERGAVRINPNVKGQDRTALMRHQKTFIKEIKQGNSFTGSYQKALASEHRGMTKHQIQQYEGRLGAIARYHPSHFKSGWRKLVPAGKPS